MTVRVVLAVRPRESVTVTVMVRLPAVFSVLLVKDEPESVSYTHLDVYKRQVMHITVIWTDYQGLSRRFFLYYIG